MEPLSPLNLFMPLPLPKPQRLWRISKPSFIRFLLLLTPKMAARLLVAVMTSITTGREACFVPSGGQGPDESMPEAEAMRRYLLSQDVPPHLILAETASKNTLENMSFSKKIIRESSPDAKVVFSTTSYHVFRSGLWANLAGFPAEGIGSKTKWWYWPNAFMRETAGLLRKRWKQEILLLVILLVWFGTLSMLLG